MASATRTRPGKQTPKIEYVYYQHLEGGAIHGYDKAFLEGAFASLNLPPHLKAKQKRKHPLEEIAIQIRKRVLIPVAAPGPEQINTVEIDPDVVNDILAKERELARERKLAALDEARARLTAGEDVDLTPYLRLSVHGGPAGHRDAGSAGARAAPGARNGRKRRGRTRGRAVPDRRHGR